MLFGQSLQGLAVEGAGYAGLGKVIDGVLGHHGKYGIDVLVVDHAEDDAQLSAGLCQYLRYDVLEPSGVVPGVADETGRCVELLPASHESGELAHVGKSFTHSLFADVVADAFQFADSMEEGVDIFLLAVASQCYSQVAIGGGLLDVVVYVSTLASHHWRFLGKGDGCLFFGGLG